MVLGLCVTMGLALSGSYLGIAALPFLAIAKGLFILAALFWLVLAPCWLMKTWRPVSPSLRGVVGVIVIFPLWAAFLVLHDVSPWLLLTFAVIVWVADIFAYFIGKGWGRHKLAPAMSPGKTMEGALGGLTGVALYFVLWRVVVGTNPVQDWAQPLLRSDMALFTLFLLLGVLSIVGDLFESWMKRGVGLKDSSGLLPGHGGILDRIDALTSTLPVAALYFLFVAAL